MLAQVGVGETFTLVESPPPTPLALSIFPDNLSAHSPQLLPTDPGPFGEYPTLPLEIFG